MIYLANETNVKWLGRTLYKDGITYLGYSCSGIEFEFIGTKAEVRLWTDGEKWPKHLRVWMAVFINDEKTPSKRFCLNQKEAVYALYEAEQEKRVKIKLVKYSEAAFAKVGIKEVILEGSKPQPTPDHALKIEFIGDSITCGYGNEGVLGENPFTTAQENPYLAYAVQAAERLEADYHLICWGGMGILSNWTTQNQPNGKPYLMPELYPYTNLDLSKIIGEKVLWDFKKFEADYVVIHLGTNDCSYTQGLKEREMAFEAAYYEFLLMVRRNHPKAYIICTLGGMDTCLAHKIQEAVQSYRKHEKDEQVETLFFENQIEEDGIGTDYHPSLITHQKMANTLVQTIQKVQKEKTKTR